MMTLKDWLIVIGVIILVWIIIGGTFSTPDYSDNAPEGIENYNNPPDNPYGN